MINPYEAPNRRRSAEACRTSVLRGTAAAFCLGIAGYALPILIVGGYYAMRYGQHAFRNGFLADVIDAHLRMSIDDLKIIGPSIGCTLLFGLAGFVCFTPAQSPGLIHTMTRIGIASIGGVFVMGLATTMFGLTTQSYTSDPHAPVRFAIFATIPVAYSIWLLNRQLQLPARATDNRTDVPGSSK